MIWFVLVQPGPILYRFPLTNGAYYCPGNFLLWPSLGLAATDRRSCCWLTIERRLTKGHHRLPHWHWWNPISVRLGAVPNRKRGRATTRGGEGVNHNFVLYKSNPPPSPVNGLVSEHFSTAMMRERGWRCDGKNESDIPRSSGTAQTWRLSPADCSLCPGLDGTIHRQAKGHHEVTWMQSQEGNLVFFCERMNHDGWWMFLFQN